MGKRKPIPRKGDIWQSREFGHLAQVLAAEVGSVEFQWVTRMGRKPFRNTPPQTARVDVFTADYERKAPARVARRKLHWTPREDAILLREWTDCERRTLMAKLPGRTWFSIHKRATLKHGLPSGDDSRITLRAAARRAGFACETFRKMLTRAGVNLHVGTKSASTGARPRYFVEWEEAESVVRAHLHMETLTVAARRIGVAPETLRRWVRAVDCKVTPFEAQHPAWFDLAAKAAGWFDGCEKLVDATARTGMCHDTLRRLLMRSLAVHPGKKKRAVYVHPEAVDRVVALWRRKQARVKAQARCGTQAEGEGQTISADTRIVCEPASPCSPVRRTKSPTMGRANR